MMLQLFNRPLRTRARSKVQTHIYHVTTGSELPGPQITATRTEVRHPERTSMTLINNADVLRSTTDTFCCCSCWSECTPHNVSSPLKWVHYSLSNCLSIIPGNCLVEFPKTSGLFINSATVLSSSKDRKVD